MIAHYCSQCGKHLPGRFAVCADHPGARIEIVHNESIEPTPGAIEVQICVNSLRVGIIGPTKDGLPLGDYSKFSTRTDTERAASLICLALGYAGYDFYLRIVQGHNQ